MACLPPDVVDLSAVRRALDRRLQLMREGVHQAKVFVVISGKGGVGKSSLAAALAVAWAATGLRVGLMEMDEQGNNAEDVGFIGTVLADGGAAQAAAILDGKRLTPTGEARPGLFVFPGGPILEEVMEELYCQRRAARHTADAEEQQTWMGMYAAAIDAVRDDYDVIILDVAPGSEVLQIQALVAGDDVLIPSRSDPSSRKGLRTVAKRFGQARALNPMLRLLGVVLFGSNFSASKVQTTIKEQLADDLRGSARVFEQVIRYVESAAVACRTHGKVPQELRTSRAIEPSVRRSMAALASDYLSLAMEVMQAKAEADRAAGTETEEAA